MHAVIYCRAHTDNAEHMQTHTYGMHCHAGRGMVHIIARRRDFNSTSCSFIETDPTPSSDPTDPHLTDIRCAVIQPLEPQPSNGCHGCLNIRQAESSIVCSQRLGFSRLTSTLASEPVVASITVEAFSPKHGSQTHDSLRYPNTGPGDSSLFPIAGLTQAELVPTNPYPSQCPPLL